MKRTKEEILNAAKAIIGERSDDEALAFLEDISDTFESGSGENWEQKFRENDAAWRERYRSRFFEGDMNPAAVFEEQEEQEETDDYVSYDDVFEKEDKK